MIKGVKCNKVVFWFFVTFCFQVSAASFDCSKATTIIEKTICSDTLLSRLDMELGKIYLNLKKRVPLEQWNEIKSTQIVWLKKRNSICANANRDCLLQIIQQRLNELNSIEPNLKTDVVNNRDETPKTNTTNWDVDQINDNYVRYKTHGTMVWGHQFGFIKDSRNCTGDNLWISWSTAAAKASEINDSEVNIEINIDGTLFPIEINMVSAKQLTPNTTVISLTNYFETSNIINFLSRSKFAIVSIVKPVSFLGQLDVYSDTFNLCGFQSAHNNAHKKCMQANINTASSKIKSQPSSIKIKGFFIGMSIDDAIDLINTKYPSIFGLPNIESYSGNIKRGAYIINSLNKSYFVFDSSKLLIKLFWPEDIVNQLFNVEDLSAEQFAQEFVNSYDVPKMDAHSDNNSVGIAASAQSYWEYISKDAIRLRIFGPGEGSALGFFFTFKGKDILLERALLRRDRSFD